MRFLFVAAFVAIIACTQADEEKRNCRDNKDCAQGTECCVTEGIFRRGVCKPRSQEKDSCSAAEDMIGLWDKKYYKHCPCADEFVCEPEETKEIPFVGTVKINERCVKPEDTTAVPKESTSVAEVTTGAE